MSSSLLHGARNELERLYDEVADSFRRLDITAAVLMVGGSRMLWFARRVTSIQLDDFRRRRRP